MGRNDFDNVLRKCPRVVPVFMVVKPSKQTSEGEYVYWSWTREMMSHKGPIEIDHRDLEFIGYAPMMALSDHQWPNTSQLVNIE